MEIIVSITVGLLVAIGIWMLLDRGLLRVCWASWCWATG